MNKIGMNAQELRLCLEFVAETVIGEESRLTSLDSAIGDGDHGITMRIGFEAIKRKLSSLEETADLERVFDQAGKSFMGATGGAIGVLLGSMLTASGKALSGSAEMGAAEFKRVLEAMESSLIKLGKAKPGDKTILDAVHAACETVTNSGQADLLSLCKIAAEAAAKGAENTASMLCARGRASRLGDRVLGHPDPGAVSFSIILAAMAKWLADRPD
ncbi:MAG TPA: dihydroxyacetone kinase subunit DhaL [Terriglobia bacterium]|nr:dihydroxyacetone kinase subunit DhaL [Terriglobia bacterium]